MVGHLKKITVSWLNLIACEKHAGEKVVMDQVLLIGTPTQTKLGQPLVPGAYVETVVEQQTLSDKVEP